LLAGEVVKERICSNIDKCSNIKAGQ
jgi:hypothetical protein